MSKLHYIILLIVVLAIATLTYKLSTTLEDTVEVTDPKLRHDPDYFIGDFVATMYDNKGLASYFIKANYLEHFPDDDTIKITDLKINYHDKQKQTWVTTSKDGIGYENIEVLHLSGDVKIENQPENPDKKLVLLTDQLRIDFKARQATTDSKVKILGKNSTINANGMDIDLDTGTLHLKSQARGHYVPN